MKRKALFLAVVAFLALAPSLANPVAAQVTTATLSGVVTDETQGAIPGATVTVRAIETSAVRVLATDGEGRYRAEGLEPGAYEISVELAGFQTTRRPDVRLSLGQHLTLNVTIGVGRVEDVVTVTGEAPVIDTNGSSVSAVVDAQQIRELPLNGRDFSQLTLLH